MAISKAAKNITEQIYIAYGSGSGVLFGIKPTERLAVEAVVQCVLYQLEEHPEFMRE